MFNRLLKYAIFFVVFCTLFLDILLVKIGFEKNLCLKFLFTYVFSHKKNMGKSVRKKINVFIWLRMLIQLSRGNVESPLYLKGDFLVFNRIVEIINSLLNCMVCSELLNEILHGNKKNGYTQKLKYMIHLIFQYMFFNIY